MRPGWRAALGCLCVCVLPCARAHGPEYIDQIAFQRTWLHRRGENITGRRLAAEEEHGIRISLHTDALEEDISDKNKRDYLVNDLLQAAVRWLSLAVKVPPVIGNLRFQKQCSSFWQAPWAGVCNQVADDYQVCGATTIPNDHFADQEYCPAHPENCKVSPGGAGIPNSDFALYVTARDTTFCGGGGTLAYASHCRQDGLDRPIAGYINLCPRSSVMSADWHVNVATIVHEILHALVFSPSLYAFYRDASGHPRTHRDWLNLPPLSADQKYYVADENTIREVTNSDGSKKHYVVLPEVLHKASEYYGCDAVDALPLEEEGGDGSAFAHWDQRDFYSEVMTLESANFPRVSPMTLAMLEASGWYTVDYSYSGAFHYGRNKGCGFLTQQCVKDGATDFPDTFCTNTDVVSCSGRSGPIGCTSGRMGKAQCNACRWTKPLQRQFRYFEDSHIGAPPSRAAMAYCPIWEPLPQGREFAFCHVASSDAGTANRNGEAFGHASRCIMSSASQGRERSALEGSCHEVKCEQSAVKIRVDSHWVTCAADDSGRKVQVDSIANGWTGEVECPPFHDVCQGQLTEGGACYFPGTVQDGRCICPPGNIGADCHTEDRSENRAKCPFGLQYMQEEWVLKAGVELDKSEGMWSWPARPFILHGPHQLQYTAAPKLPDGLRLLADGTVTGTPSSAVERSTHVVTATSGTNPPCATTATIYITVACADDDASCLPASPATEGTTSSESGSTGPIGDATLAKGELPLWRMTLGSVHYRDVQQAPGLTTFATQLESTLSEVLSTTAVLVYAVEKASDLMQVEVAVHANEVGNSSFAGATERLVSILQSGGGEITSTEFGGQYLHSIELVSVTEEGLIHLWPPPRQAAGPDIVSAKERDATIFATGALFVLTMALTCLRPEERLVETFPCAKIILHAEASVQGLAFLAASVLFLMHLQPGVNGELSFAMSGWLRWQIVLLQIACVLFIIVIAALLAWWMTDQSRGHSRQEGSAPRSLEAGGLTDHRDMDTSDTSPPAEVNVKDMALAFSSPLVNILAMILVAISAFSKVIPELRKRNPEFVLKLEGWQKAVLWTSFGLIIYSGLVSMWDYCRKSLQPGGGRRRSADEDLDEDTKRRNRLILRSGSFANLVATVMLLLIAVSKIAPEAFQDVQFVSPTDDMTSAALLVAILALGAIFLFLFVVSLSKKKQGSGADEVGMQMPPLPEPESEDHRGGDVRPMVVGLRSTARSPGIGI
mmetsp:Transcript_45636/g.108641  ORF Transcript_45636/g.108641 Transcript_45636/m.108641 type:complete len:1236 (+) Transcript_45636:58-3765(+)